MIAQPIAGLPNEYLLFVGDRAGYKNFDALLKCFAELKRLYPKLYIFCAGGGGFTDAELHLQRQLHVSEYCLQANVAEAQLTCLYQQAQLFVFPSLYEGFGYPLLEAFRAGCAVAASNTSSFPEVGGNAVHYFAPNDLQSMYKAINTLLTDDALKKAYIKKGYQQLERFTLQQEITETLNFYTSLVGTK